VPNLHGISQRAFDHIVAEEVSSKQRYEREYQHPVKPGGASGVTVGIGYDLGHHRPDAIRRDWAMLPQPMVEAMVSVSGITGDAANAACRRVRGVVRVPWEAALQVFADVSLPKYVRAARNKLPNFDELSPDCRGALTGLTYNRGASFDKAGDRYREMRAIRAAMEAREFERIPALLIAMKRLWTTKSVRGVAARREHEAEIFRVGLAAMSRPQRAIEEPEIDEDEAEVASWDAGDEISSRSVTASVEEEADIVDEAVASAGANTPGLNVQPVRGVYSIEVEVAQRELQALGYHEVGDIDGYWGGKTAAGIKAFFVDRGVQSKSEMGPVLSREIAKAKKERWSRPIAPARANATPQDLAPKVETVRVSLWGRFSAKVAGGFAAIGLTGSTISSAFQSVQDTFYPVRNFFSKIPPEVWFLLMGVVAALVWYVTNKTAQSATKDYNTGRLN
jgi:hypothetical protein